jgi:DNA helicase IV
LENPDVLQTAILAKERGREEERRLFYVAVTRAKENVIVYTQWRIKSKLLDEIKNDIQWFELE